jgi:DNA-binding transcriptional LysR family regulator
MPSADRLREFAQIVANGSITGAAKSLDVPRATLSRRLSNLEHELGVRLMHRQTRKLVLTDAGRELHRRAMRINADTIEAWDAVRQLDDTPRGLLRVSVSAGLDPDLFLDFLRDYPKVTLEVRKTTRHVDLIGEGVDVAVRFGPVKDPNLYVRRVTTVRSVIVAAPAYVHKRGAPTHPRELTHHDCVLGITGDWIPTRVWPLLDGGNVPVQGRLVANDVVLMHAAALRGDGLVLLPEPIIAADIRAGRLMTLLDSQVGTEGPVSLVYADREYIDPKVRVFVDRAAAHLAKWFEKSNEESRRASTMS